MIGKKLFIRKICKTDHHAKNPYECFIISAQHILEGKPLLIPPYGISLILCQFSPKKKQEETRGSKLNIMQVRYFEHHLGPTPSGPVQQMGLLLQSLCSSSDPCWWKKNSVYTWLELKVHQVFFLLVGLLRYEFYCG